MRVSGSVRGAVGAAVTVALALFLAFSGQGCGASVDVNANDERVGTIEEALTSAATKIDCGGPAASPYVADDDFSGGSTVTRANTIDLSAAYNPAPASVYQSQRFGNFTYTLPGFGAKTWNRVRLHFADTHWTAAGQRVFNVTINGSMVLKNFDIIARVGAGNKALVESFTMQANASGQYVIQFATVTDAATVSGIEVFPTAQSGTPTTLSGTAYAQQCAQQLVPLPPNFGGGGTGAGTCAACFQTNASCIGCKVGSWTYAGQVSPAEAEQSFNGPDAVEIFYWESGGNTPGLCMMAARNANGGVRVDFHGVMCQAASGPVCYWDLAQPAQFSWAFTGNDGPNEDGHLAIPTTAKVITSTTSIPSPPAFVGGSDLAYSATSSIHSYQNACTDCHAGRNTFNNHPGTATDLKGRGLVTSATDWFPMAWPSPIAPAWDPSEAPLGAPWPLNPGPLDTSKVSGSTSCPGCHTEGQIGGPFPQPSLRTPFFCATLVGEAMSRSQNNCPGTFPWDPTKNPDINCPTGAMPPDSNDNPFNPSFGQDAFGDFTQAHQTGVCNGLDFRTQFLAPPGGSTLLKTAVTPVSTMGYSGSLSPATTYGIASATSIKLYDPLQLKWITTKGTTINNKTVVPPGTLSQIFVSTGRSITTLSQSGTTSFVCKTPACSATGVCNWVCDTSGYSSFAQMVVQVSNTNGEVVVALDQGRHTLLASFPGTSGAYVPDSFFAIMDFDDPIANLAVGGDGDLWALTQTGVIWHEAPNEGWVTVGPPFGVTPVSLAVANANDVWVASSSGLFRFSVPTESWEEKHCATTGCGSPSFTTVLAGGDSTNAIAEVWALDSAGNAYRVDRTQPNTVNSMAKIPGATITRLSVGGQGDVMGINSSGTVFTFQ